MGNSEVLKRRGNCAVCGFGDISCFFAMRQVPVFCNVLYPTREEAVETPRGDIVLGFCSSCGFIANLTFEPGQVQYAPNYENALHFSPRFQDYAGSLARHLIDRYALRGKTVLEIACGDGTFLRLLCELGASRGIGFDPSCSPEPGLDSDAATVRIIRDYYSERYVGCAADLICCRHALEHIPDPLGFLRMVRRSPGCRKNTVVYFEVPNVMFTLRDLGIWDILYEHCCYFAPESLARCFQLAGFEILDTREEYNGQFLAIEAAPCRWEREAVPGKPDSLETLARLVQGFDAEYESKTTAWSNRLDTMRRAGQRVVLWGAGSKGVMFLNALNVEGVVTHVVDINPRKQGMFVAGTGQQIVAPERLCEDQPDYIILMNPIYHEEIQQKTSKMGIAAELLVA